MNIAVGTLLLFLLVVPGISFRNAYFFGALTKKYSKASAFDDFIWGIIPGIIFQLLGVCFINKFNPYNYQINLEALGKILFGTDAANQFLGIQENIGAILFYNIALIIVAAGIGYFLRKTIRFLYLDYYYKHLRFNNEWFYILRGETIFFKENDPYEKLEFESGITWANVKNAIPIILHNNFPALKKRFILRKKIETCRIHAVVDIDDGTYIYSGVIQQFFISKSGDLDSVSVKLASRRKFYDTIQTPEVDLQETDVVVLKGSEIRNISVVTEKDEDLPVEKEEKKAEASPTEETVQHPSEVIQQLESTLSSKDVEIEEYKKQIEEFKTQVEGLQKKQVISIGAGAYTIEISPKDK